MPRPTLRPILLVAILAVTGGVAIAGSEALGQSPGPRTITLKETERGSTFKHVSNTRGAPRRSNLQGDVVAFTNPLVDPAGTRVGKLSMTCTTTTGARDFAKSTMTCVGVMALRDGTLMVQGNVSLSAESTTAAVIGGTGAYAGARGQVVSASVRDGSVDTITLLG